MKTVLTRNPDSQAGETCGQNGALYWEHSV